MTEVPKRTWGKNQGEYLLGRIPKPGARECFLPGESFQYGEWHGRDSWVECGNENPFPQDKGYISHRTQSRQNESLSVVGSLIAARGGELP